MQHLNSISEHVHPLPLVDEVSVAGADMESLLLRYSELRQDVARLRNLLEDLAQHIVSHQVGRRTLSKRASRLNGRLDAGRQMPPKHAAQRRSIHRDNSPQVRSKLERACLIALMESSEPVSAETIYDRIERRGSFTFASYKHPLRAIVLAMGAMVRHGEALLHNEGTSTLAMGTEGDAGGNSRFLCLFLDFPLVKLFRQSYLGRTAPFKGPILA